MSGPKIAHCWVLWHQLGCESIHFKSQREMQEDFEPDSCVQASRVEPSPLGFVAFLNHRPSFILRGVRNLRHVY